jgi:hypothetical protein
MGLPNLLEIRDGAIHGESPEPIPFDPILFDTATHYFRDPEGKSTLELRRVDFTRIEASFRTNYQVEEDKLEGRFVLGCGFVLGAESDDGEEGAYFVDEYWSTDGNISIRIGKDGDRLAATVPNLNVESQGRSHTRLYEDR